MQKRKLKQLVYVSTNKDDGIIDHAAQQQQVFNYSVLVKWLLNGLGCPFYRYIEELNWGFRHLAPHYNYTITHVTCEEYSITHEFKAIL